MILYKTKIGYLGQCPNTGKIKNMNSSFLIEALELSDLDKTLTEYLKSDIDSYTVKSLNRIEIDELVSSEREEDDKFFICTVKMMVFDNESGKESSKKVKIIIQNEDLEKCSKKLHELMQKNVSDYEVKSITETTITDIILK
jgi:K+/H+ antiporter YhaU regulatory subunit KhtT